MSRITTFKGYLLKFGRVEFPADYLLESSYRCIPSQRTVLDEYRDGDNITHKEIDEHYKTRVEVDTDSYLDLNTKAEIQEIIKAGLLDETQRLYQITYWNDETNTYQTGKFFMDDIPYTILSTTDDNIIYDSMSIVLNEQ